MAFGMGFEVIDVEFVKSNAEWNLCVYIDKRGGIHIDDCEKLSKELSGALDDEELFNRAYNLVVSSPGLDRPLKTGADFRRYEGALVDVQMQPGRAKDGVREEAAVEAAEDAGAAGVREEAGYEEIKPIGKPKKPGRAGGNPDVISGSLVRLDGGRLYLSDGQGRTFSLAWEDIKTVKRAIRFK